MVARAALEELKLDRLFLIPAARSPFKTTQPKAPAACRLRLLRMAFAGWPDCQVDPQELGRDGASYSVDTVRNFAGRFPGATLHYLVGADHVATLPQWREAGALAALAQFAVLPRPGQVAAGFPAPFRGAWLQGQPMAVAASVIRDRVRAGLPVDHLVPAAVAAGITEMKLYTG